MRNIMENPEQNEYQRALNHFGFGHQLMKLAEEAVELADAAFKLRKRTMCPMSITAPARVRGITSQRKLRMFLSSSPRWPYMPMARLMGRRNSPLAFGKPLRN